jgi:hypothetical protein
LTASGPAERAEPPALSPPRGSCLLLAPFLSTLTIIATSCLENIWIKAPKSQPGMDRATAVESAYVNHPIRSLTALFVVWKALLFLIVANCPGPGYDTSTTLLAEADESARILKFVRWDAIYFVRAAERGYLFEQEWAFSYGRVLRVFTSGMHVPITDFTTSADILLCSIY